MSALAKYFIASGNIVAGYDKTPSVITNSLEEIGCSIHFTDDVSLIPNAFKTCLKEELLVIYTPAINFKNTELQYFTNNNIEIKKRSQILGLISENHKTLAVSGTHGKTSVSTILAHVFNVSNKSTNAILGGISKNFNSNLLLANNSSEAEFLVTEADEFDRSFLHLFPETAVITSIDEDHLDIYSGIEDLYNTFGTFAGQINKNGTLLIKQGIQLEDKFYPKNVFTYSLEEKSDFYATNVKNSRTSSTFDLVCPNKIISNIELKIPGKLNIENAIAAAAVAVIHGIDDVTIINALKTWTGVKRRFDYVINTEKLVFIDDYAHHPEELKAFINSVAEIYPDKNILGVFQPHLFTRTRDFADEFAESLNLLNQLILLDIYPAREEPIQGVSSNMIFDKVSIQNKTICNKDEMLNVLKNKEFDVLLTIGAGDVGTKVELIKKMISNRQ